MRRTRRKLRAVVWVLLVVATASIAYGGYSLWNSNREALALDKSYGAISSQVKRAQGSANGVQGGLSPDSKQLPQVEIPDIGLDFDALREISENCAGWLYCPDTVIDYPVMRADNYDFYLTHLPDGTYNVNGSIFLDYHCQPDFSDTLSILYGHNMKSGRMFGSLTGYKKQSYYEEHPYLYLYTEQGNYRVDLIYGFVIGAGQWRDRGFMHQENSAQLLEYAAANTTFSGTAYGDTHERYIVLSTCSYEFNNARYAVIGVLIAEYAQ